MTRPLPLIHQFDGSPHAGANCQFVAVAHALSHATENELRPAPEQLRHLAEPVSGPGDAANTGDAVEAWGRSIPEAAALGWRLRPAERHPDGEFSDVIAALDDGYGVGLSVDYATINDHRPVLSGDPRYRGGHALYLGRIRRRGNRTQIKVWDGMCDGRRPGIPHGPLWYPSWLLKMAAEDWNKGRVAFVVYRPGATLDAQKFQPESADRVTDLEQALGMARAALVANSDEAIAALDDIDELLPPLTDDPDASATDGAARE